MAEESTQQQGQQQAGGDQNFSIHINEDNRAGKYSNAVSVHVNSNEVVLDFGYIQPGQQNRRIDVVSRVNLNHTVARSFMTLLQDAILDFQNKMKEREQQQAQQNSGSNQAAA